MPSSTSFPIVIEAVGGTYVDEATGFALTLSTPLRLKLDTISSGQVLAVTPLTEISARLSQNDARSIAETNHALARRLSGQGIEAIDIATVVPANVIEPPSAGSSNTQVAYGLLLAMVSQYAHDRHSGDLGSALNALTADFADGIFDQRSNELAMALSAFQASSRNQSGITASPLVEIVRLHGNNAPVASDGSVTVAYESSVTSALIAADANGDPLSFSVTGAPTKGNVTLTGASFTYTALAGQSGADTFVFRASDGTSSSNTASIAINIGLPNNTPPVANNGSLSVAYNTATNGTLSGSDADNNPLTYSIVTNGTKGTAVITNTSTGAYTYTPQSGQTGADSFSFRVNDGTQNSLVATVDIVINGPNNTAPVANNGSLSVLWNTQTLGTLNASDSDGDSLTYSLVSTPAVGSVALGTNGQYTYTPGTGTGTTSFTYRVNDGTVDSNTATVTVSIQGGNVASGQTLFNSNCGSCHIASDRAGRSVTQIRTAIDTVPTMNSAALRALTNTQLGDIAAWLWGATSNTAPVANNGSLSVAYNTATNGTLSGSDADNNPLTYSIVTNGTKGTAVITNTSTGAYTYTPQSGQTGADSFSFRVNDGITNSSPATISVTIGAAPNTAPVANNGSLSVLWNTPTTGTLSASDSDSDPLTYSLMSTPSVGSVTLGTNGQYTYTPGAGTGTTSFTYRVNDGTVDSNIATVTISIQGGDPSNGQTLFNNNCLSCHTIAARQGRSVTQIKNAISTVPSMSSRSNLQALTDAQLGDIAARLAQ